MLENQAFGWLKNAIKGSGPSIGSPSNAAAISACSDPAVLVSAVAQDFNVALNASIAASGSDVAAAVSSSEGTTVAAAPDNAAAASAENGADSSATEADGASNDHLDDLTARLDRIKILLYEERSASSNAVAQSGSINLNWIPAIATGVFKNFTTESDVDELIPKLIQNLPLLPFEARKSVSAIFNYLLVCGLDGLDAQQFASVSSAFAKYVCERADGIIGQLVGEHDCKPTSEGGAGCVDITLLCGSMLRSSLRHASIYQWMLSDGNCERLVYPFLDCYVHNPNFDVSSDALETVRVMFTGVTGGSAAAGILGDQASEEHKQLMEGIASDFLNRKYVDVIDERINNKCLSSKANYMTRRMSLQLLSSILLNRANYNVMMLYISSSQNLVTILCLLRDPSPHITLDAFQVFKIFVANPNKVSLRSYDE